MITYRNLVNVKSSSMKRTNNFIYFSPHKNTIYILSLKKVIKNTIYPHGGLQYPWNHWEFLRYPTIPHRYPQNDYLYQRALLVLHCICLGGSALTKQNQRKIIWDYRNKQTICDITEAGVVDKTIYKDMLSLWSTTIKNSYAKKKR